MLKGLKASLQFFILFVWSVLFLGFAHGQNTESDSLKKLLDTAKSSPQRVLILESLSYSYVSSYPDTALLYATEGLQLAKKIHDKPGEAYCTNAFGNVYFSVGDYAKALEMYFQALKMKEQLHDNPSSMAVSYFNIANVYTEQEDYRHALSYLLKAKQVDESVKDSAAILFDLYSLGSIYLRMHMPDSALYYTRHSYQFAQILEDRNMMAAILNNFAETYAFLKDNTLAAGYYYKSIPYALEVNDNEVLAVDYYGLAKIFRQKNVLDSAIYFARKALQIARKTAFQKQVLETSTFLKDVFKSKGLFDSAFAYQELSTTTKDSLFNVENVRKVQSLKLQEQQRQQAIVADKIAYRNKIKLYLVIFASAIFLIIAIVLWRNNKQKQKAYRLLEQEKLKTERAFEELKTTQAQLIQSEKMASLGEMTAGVAHEIQNPLNFVNNFAEINKELLTEMQAEIKKGNLDLVNSIANDLIENQEKINSHGKRADSIVKNMLQHSRTGSGKREPTNINALCDEYLSLSYHGFRARDKSFNVTFQTEFDNSIGKMNIIPSEIGRVLLNLYNNAFYSVSAKKKSQGEGFEPKVSVTTTSTNSRTEIHVKDNGTGISEKALDKIFQPFFTTKPPGQGTGLGLSLAYDIVKAHGGELTVESVEGEGAEFVVRLPMV